MKTFNPSEIVELIDALEEALALLEPIRGGYSEDFSSAEDFYSDLSKTVDNLREGKPVDIDKLWSWFAPTCAWDDFGGDASVGQRVFEQVQKVKGEK